MAPVTVFLVAIACLLAAAAAVRPLALRTNVPEAVWLIALGVVLRTTGIVPPATIAALAPFFAAVALIIVLFEAGRDMVFGAASDQVVRARKLALAGAALVVPLVALFSQALSGLHLLPVWSWTHAFMLGALMLCTAPEVFAPTLYRRAHPGLVAALEREAALTGALAIAATAFCIDLLSLRVPVGKAYAAIAAGFGLALAFGAFAGLLWISAIRRVGPGRGVYPYTLAAILALYVVTDTLGGIGALAVLVFGAVVSNAGPLVGALFRPRGGTVVEAADEDFRAALDDHARTVEITRVLLFTYLGMNLGPPWGLLAMGIVLGLLLVVLRLLAARLVLRGVDERTFSALALGWPRGMLVAGLAALPHAAAVPGTESLTTLVFAAVATTCVAFGVAVSPLGHAHVSGDMSQGKGPSGHAPGAMSGGTGSVRAVAPAATVDEVMGKAGAPAASAEGPASPGAVLTTHEVRGGVPGEAGGEGLGGSPAAGGTGEAGSLGGSAALARETLAGETAVAGEPGVTRTLLDEVSTSLAAGSAQAAASGKTLAPEEAVVSGRTVVPEGPGLGGKTLPPEEAVLGGKTLLSDASGGERRGLFAIDMPPTGRTLVPGEPLAGSRTLLPGESSPGMRSADVPRFAPPGSRSSERTVLRGSGPGAPELVRHVFISSPAGTTVTRETSVVQPRTTEASGRESGLPVRTANVESSGAVAAGLPVRTVNVESGGAASSGRMVNVESRGATSSESAGGAPASAMPTIATREVAAETPVAELPVTRAAREEAPAVEPAVQVEPGAPGVAGLEVAVTFTEPATPEPPKPAVATDPPLLELVGEAILPSGHVLKNLVKDTGEGGTKEG
ncbi:cation:proton antiporter [Nannocystis sp. RBIL2]|uniref:cation:proton antiporter n=1 Tax=Nannocystis sp. RBIL2 TaxID=2996788 RepID=UPI002270C6FE|nr:cation:proton antiporter [Nannocystis sp. RBIL2]MCY1072151.1 cation:proton antiporter [Nannocystis sp. RBIL2]